ncbi:hypothetical protein GHV40_07955 [Devosia sp. D6-9]|nr:hypothetical protein GHV40_07955 [Devosia sp. D6-9]
MDLLFDIILWLHFTAFVVGGANVVTMPFLVARMHAASPETRQALCSIAKALSRAGRGAMVVLLITGPILMWQRYGGLSGASVWFWIKMALIVLMLVSIIAAGITFKRAEAGDDAALETAETAGRIAAVAFLGVLLSAVFAFN